MSILAAKLTKETINEIVKVSGIKLSDDRVKVLLPIFEQALEDFEKWEKLNLSEVSPDIIFDARRRRK